MTGKPVVFLGPSLDASEARNLLDAEYRPPVSRGDLDDLMARADPPAIIGIIDGAFFQGLAVTPKEILRALERGARLFGSSSMGALRATECSPFGMVGIGRIYQAYQSGEVDADDEVAVGYDPETGQALSEPLINLRFAIAAGVAAGEVDPAAGAAFLSTAERLYFPHRTTANVLRLLAGQVPADQQAALGDFLAHRAVDTKRDDAILLLAAVRSAVGPGH